MGDINVNIGERIVSARKMSGFSLQSLSDKLENSISKQALNKYEKGINVPNSTMLIKIANILDVPLDYFFRAPGFQLSGIEFRKRSRLSKRQIDMIKGEAIDFLERYLELEALMNIKSEFKNPLKDNNDSGIQDIESKSHDLRNKWKLGIDPIPCVVELLEEKEVKILEGDFDEQFDGMSAVTDHIFIIVINKNITPQRKRLTLLHELAHQVLKIDDKLDERSKEKLCSSFAGAFLLPEKPFIEEWGSKRSNVSIEELKFIDEYYGISIQAVIARAKSLGLISEHTYRQFNIWLNKHGYRKHEFGKFMNSESPGRFKRLIHKAVSEGVITMSKAAALSNSNLESFMMEYQSVG